MTQIGIIDAEAFVTLTQNNKNIEILDIRSDLEHNALQLDYKTTHIPLHDVDVAAQPKSKSETYILCKMGPRAFKLAEALAEHGHENLIVIDGGIMGCAQSGIPLKKSENQPTPEQIMTAVQESFQKFMIKNG